MQLAFHKMHGLGNDFMLLDCRDVDFVPSIEQICAWSDRHKGIGFDQLISINTDEKGLYYRFFNADGGEAEQCGNGQRCIAMYLDQYTDIGLPVQINGLGGSVELNISNEGYIASFKSVKEVSQIGDWSEVSEALIYVDLGNPHLVMTKSDIAAVDLPSLADKVHVRFPEGINIEVIESSSPESLSMRVFERGVGETQACGSGACAALIGAGYLLEMPTEAQVAMPGGKVMVKYDVDSGVVSLSGPASYVFQGYLEITV
ncbi:diaminopimelate epimerase [Marinicella sp. W31]|uniref:diaminopimelate epimerase n=1 Tax=Marinicella sp. W31 TaxID=3023713 RepID=UPI003758421E